ncbi:MAG: WD40/YVTN/BNR-like repeat-containing protein [Cyclobacteriaceae bacterium]
MKRIFLLFLAVAGFNFSYSQNAVLKGKELFGDMKARHIGPALMSGRITDVELHPANDRVIYIGTAGGGVWKSNNGGATFNPIFDEYNQSIGAVEIDPSNPDQVVWAGTGEVWTRNSVAFGDGIYRSGDGGTTWKKMGLEKSERIAGIQVNPKNPNEVYAGVLGALWSDSDERGVYKTTDGGQTWNKILFVDKMTGCSDLLMDPTNPEVIYAAFWEFRRSPWSFNSGGANSALFKSTDGGKTWNKIHNGFPKGKLGRIAVAVAPSQPSTLYAVIESEQDKDKGLYRSDDSGASWKQLNNDFEIVVRPFYFSRITVDPRNPDVVVKAGLSGSISRDGGKTFKNLGFMHSDIHDVVFDIHNSDRMYAATDGGVYRSWDGGTTMEMVENIPVSQFYQVSVDNDEPYNVYGGLQDNGSWVGPSRSPGGVEASDWKRVGVGDGYRVLRHPTKKLIYSEMQGAENVWRFDPEKDQAKSIQPLAAKGDPKLRFNWNSPMAVSKHQPDRFYMGSQFVHRSEDMGETWVKISPDLTTNDPKKMNQEDSGGLSRDNSGAENHCTIFTITESPLDENVIWAGTDDGNVQITRDGGKTWTNVVANVPGVPKNTLVHHIEASVFDKGTAYVTFEGHMTGDFNPYVYKTTDYGVTWKSLVTPDLGSLVRNIQEDYENQNILYLGAEDGLYITIDGAKTWLKFTNNMPSVPVHFIDLHAKTNDLVLGTHGRGVIIIDDISPLRQLTAENLAQELYFFKTGPTYISESNGFGGTATETQFVGANPTSAARIMYHLKRKHNLGKMTLEIRDMEGNVLQELAPGKSKGINIVEWNYTIKPPKVAVGKTFTFGGFTSPRVPAGKYEAVIQKGKDTYKTELVIEYDPKSTISLADRKANEELTKKLYKMNQELAYLVFEMDELTKVAEGVKAQSSAASKVATPFISETGKLKETLVVMKGDNYVGAAEPQLREKMADLYSKVASSFYKPSKSEIDNLEALESRFNTGKAEFKKIKDKHLPKINKLLSKDKVEPMMIKTYDEFVKMQ